MMKTLQKLLLLVAATSFNSVAAPFEDNMAQRMQACTGCHGVQGRAGPDGYYPRLAGKPAGYLYNQLLNIRDGRRHYALMAGLLAPLDKPYLMAMAQYFSGLKLPYPPPIASRATPELMARGRTLVTEGDPARDLPPCQQCHGEALTGAEPHVPGLLGLPRDYLNAQLGGWRTGQRRAQAPDCMSHIAKRLSSQDVVAATHWLAAQPVPANSQPLAALPTMKAGTKELRCGSADVPQPSAEKTVTTQSAQVAQGAYLARVGNCEHCHTTPGGKPYTGQRAITTPFGTAYSTNLTPDKATGLGQWTLDDFWQALHHGKSRDGRLLSPAFPYTSYTAMRRADADALFAFLQSLPPENQPHRGHDMRWPYGTQVALFAWRTLFFSPQDFQADAARSAAWNRGAYLVNVLSHCGECHTPRNQFGAAQTKLALRGGLIPMQGWLAPSLLSRSAAGTDALRLNDTLQLLKTGHSSQATASGPMAQVVQGSTQHLNEADLQAIGLYLQSLTQTQDPSQSEVPADRLPAARAMAPAAMTRAASLYTSHCADCHGHQGQGITGAYPALAGNRAVFLADASNLIQTTLHGGFAPVTLARPKPYGMPPFMLTLGDSDIALVLSYIRQAWGNQATPVTESDVSRLREHQASR